MWFKWFNSLSLYRKCSLCPCWLNIWYLSDRKRGFYSCEKRVLSVGATRLFVFRQGLVNILIQQVVQSSAAISCNLKASLVFCSSLCWGSLLRLFVLYKAEVGNVQPGGSWTISIRPPKLLKLSHPELNGLWIETLSSLGVGMREKGSFQDKNSKNIRLQVYWWWTRTEPYDH